MAREPCDWDEADLVGLIANQVLESIELDYKECGALQKTDAKKNEISKDVSAFANSGGGTIVYGIKENGHVPIALDVGYEPREISKEWLEQVINSRIQRRIDGIRINQVQLSKGSPGRVAYVVSIPQSSRAPHQAADKKFYKRFNFESVPMEEYEVRDVGNRSKGPDLRIQMAFTPGSKQTKLAKGKNGYYAPVKLTALVANQATTPADHAVFHFFIDERIRFEHLSNDAHESPRPESLVEKGLKCTLKKITVLWDNKRGLPIFSGITVELPTEPMALALPIDQEWLLVAYMVGAPQMTSRRRSVLIFVKDDVATLEALGDSDDLVT